MRKIMFLLVLALGISMSAKAEIVARDTVPYTGAWKMDKLQTTNDYGEISVRYVCYLTDIVNKKGEPRKVPVDKATYESGNITHIVYNTNDSGTKRIAKAININVPKKAKKK
jgi:hypothetical protein